MSKSIGIGDFVSVLDDSIKGIVLAVNNQIVLLEDENGFKREYYKNELVKYDKVLDEDRSSIKKHPIQKKKPTYKKEIKSSIVIDLHYKHTARLKHTILEGQLRKFKMHLNKAIRNRSGMITFIVGVGTGVLRSSIVSILKKNNITYSDAPYHKYGNGAIEVHLTGIHKIIK